MGVTLSTEQIAALNASLGAVPALPNAAAMSTAINNAWIAAGLPTPPPC